MAYALTAKWTAQPGHEHDVDEAAFRAHGESEPFRRLAVERAIPLLESRERAFYVTLGD